ncbi:MULTISPECIES: hypothetical protein [Nonomuraea]|uniref:Subtilisin inhibitor domain-containing protein n=1 Tax=Nonomuraea mangrovi TaxID=2316207 RepID=A0ABW4TAN9_9ACTN
MKKIVVAGLGMVAALGLFSGSARGGTDQRHEVSEQQYQILIGQCRYADTPSARAQCRSQVRKQYRVGKADPALDCRTYSGVTVCGELRLGPAERACVKDSVSKGLTFRRAEVECYAWKS